MDTIARKRVSIKELYEGALYKKVNGELKPKDEENTLAVYIVEPTK